MKKFFFVLIIMLASLMPLSAQRTRDVLYLKNGSIIYGKLLEASDIQYKIKTADGSIFIYKPADVDKFINEASQFEGRRTKGFGFNLEAGFLVGPQNSDYKAPFSFNILANYTFKTKNIVSLGSGVEYIGQPFTPFFLEYKYLLHNSKTTPFLFVRGGKMTHLREDPEITSTTYPTYYTEKKYSGEGSFTAGMGISWAFESTESYLSFGYRYAHTSYTQKNYAGQTEKYKNAYNRLEVKFGFRF